MTLGFPGWRAVGWPGLWGVGIAVGQAPLGWWWVSLIALVLLFVLLHMAADWRVAAWKAWAAGLGHFGVSLSWIISPFLVEPETHGWMAPFALVLMAGGMALFWAVAGAVSWQARHRAMGFAVALAGFEALRGVVFTGFPWALIAHMWVDSAFGQLASVVGVNGLNLLTLLVVASFTVFNRWVGPVTWIAFVGAWLLGVALQTTPAGPSRDVTLRLVQPAIPQSLKWDPEAARANFTRLLDMTAQGTPADLTIWPETAVPYLIDTAPEVGQMIALASGGKPVIVGYQRVDGPLGWNSMGLVAPDGTIAQHYDKAHLVPFGEYIPLGDIAYKWFGLRAFASQVGAGYTAGIGPQVMDLGPALGTVLPLICYEAVFPQDVNAAPARADWILQITNDAWFGTLTGPWQHAAQARFRAIEQGLPLVRVGNTGVTAVYDAHGQVIDGHGATFKNGVGPVGELILPFGEVAALDVPFIPGALPPTPYSRWGEWPFVLLLAGLGAGLVLLGKRKPA
jgi:apolipoprotein N-acyltransferase